MSKEKLIPELRFPEFTDEGEWKESLLGSVVEMKGRIGYRGYTIQDIVEKGKGAITLSPSNFNENGQLNFEKCTYISWDKYEESPEIQLAEGQTVLVKTASVGKTAYVDKLPEKATVNPQIVVLKPKTIHNRFLAFTVSHYNTQDQIRNNVGAGAIPNISQEIISKLKILLPPDKKRKEQEKIASCLSSLDEVIDAHSQKLEVLKDHKKGLMQNLFPQEGKKVPKYRFKEFENDGEWMEKILSEVADYENGKAHEQDISANGKFVVVNSKFISTDGEVAKSSNTAYCLAEIGDVLMVLSDIPNGRAIAKCFYVNEKNKYTVNQRVCKITSFDCDSLFLYYTMNRNPYFLAFDDGVKQTNLRNDDVQSFPFLVPVDPKEQQKIAFCLSYLDSLITKQTENIEQLKLHKKGLMQGLFPKIND
ncbi:restriction endonuclease subunit S [Chryseobacterium sp. H3056]|uniref:Restriction endonuclease subunit S n=1 Tax=Kaistella daneshvariae TaxID=2487074 RepID=A0A3N0X040_9FLAO|nr:restriction endonuclease subunit S [Kaistella daneshvariae]ROI10754.1 restriction endonuclease subunit S [Kaistella daneshvariae]